MPVKIQGKKRPRALDAAVESAPPAGDAPAAVGGFAQAMKKVLSRELHVVASSGAVLSKRRTAAEKAEAAERALAKALRVRSAARHAKVVELNVLPGAASEGGERDLRRMATKGVIALFNAVAKHQHATQVALAEPAERAVRAQRVSTSQASFLDLLRDSTRAAAGQGVPPSSSGSRVGAPPAARPAKGSGAAWMSEGFVEASGNAKGRRAAAEAAERHSELAANSRAAPRKGILDVEDEF
jgi:hypothetical protein